MWGFNHLILLPGIYTAIYIILGVLTMLLLFLPHSKKWSESFIDWFSNAFYDSPRKYINRLIFILIMAALFILFPQPVFFFGDGYQSLANIASETGNFIKWSEKGITFILMTIRSLVGGQDQQSALTAFRIVSVTSGVVSIWFYFLIAELAGDDKTKRALYFTVSFFSGSLLLFFGYVENYPLLWIAISGFIYFGIRYFKKDKGLFGSGLFLAFGLFIHLLMVIFIPAYIYLIFSKGKGLTLYSRLRFYLWGAIIIIAVGTVYLFFKKYNSDLYFENIFLPLFKGKPIDPDYALLRVPHLLDILNQLLLLSPLILLLFILSVGNIFKIMKNKAEIYLALTAIGALAFLFVIDPGLTMPRDWDLFSLSAFPAVLLSIALLDKNHISALKKMILPLMIFLAVSTVPYLVLNLSREGSIRYIKHIIDGDIKKSMGSVVILRDYYKKNGRMREADSVNNINNTAFPNFTKMNEAMAAVKKGDIPTARQLIAGITPNKFSKDYHHLLYFYYLTQRNYSAALDEIKKSIQVQKYYFASYLLLSMNYGLLNQPDSALEALRTGYGLNNSYWEILLGLANLHLQYNHPDSTIYYCEKILAHNPDDPSAFYLLARAYKGKGMMDMVRLNADKYFRYGPHDPLYKERSEELQRLIKQ